VLTAQPAVTGCNSKPRLARGGLRTYGLIGFKETQSGTLICRSNAILTQPQAYIAAAAFSALHFSMQNDRACQRGSQLRRHGSPQSPEPGIGDGRQTCLRTSWNTANFKSAKTRSKLPLHL